MKSDDSHLEDHQISSDFVILHGSELHFDPRAVGFALRMNSWELQAIVCRMLGR